MAAGLVVAATPQAAQADPPPSVGQVLQTSGAQAAWGWIETEAKELLESEGLDTDMSNAYTRDLIRSFIYLRMIEIVDSTSRSAQEQAAFDYLKTLVVKEQYYTAYNALSRFAVFANDELNCGGVNQPWYPALGIPCVFTSMFADTPPQTAFESAGFAETFGQFGDNAQAAKVLSDMMNGTNYWAGFANFPPEVTEEGESAVDVIREVVYDHWGEAVREIVQDVAVAMIESAVHGELPSPVDWVIMGVAAVTILANGIWKAYDVLATASNLSDLRDSMDPNANPSPSPDMEALVESPGIVELGYVVAAETMPQLNPTRGCSFMIDLQCLRYQFAADPDFEGTRYAGPPPAQTEEDPFFEKTDFNGAVSFARSLPNVRDRTVSQSSERLFNAFLTGSDRLLNFAGTENGDITSARGMTPSTSTESFNSYLHDGLFVTRYNNLSTTPQDASWQYRNSINYTDAKGNWWTAWYQNGTFLQVKVGRELGGDVQLGPEVDEVLTLGVQCSENPISASSITVGSTETGRDCLFSRKGNGARLGSLQPGDQVVVLGQRRVVHSVVDCEHVNDYFVYAENSTCQDHTGTAVVLEPGPAGAIGPAFDWQGVLSDLLGLMSGFPFSVYDTSPIRLMPLNTCAGRACKGPSTDIKNCSLPVTDATKVTCVVSPTFTYAWPGGTLIGGDYPSSTVRVIQPPTAVDDSYKVNAANSALPCCGTSQLQVDASHGVLTNDDGTDIKAGSAPWHPGDVTVSIVDPPTHGSLGAGFTAGHGAFTYTPDDGFGFDAPADDHFTYEVCHTDMPAFARECDQGVVTITVRNAPPTATPVIATNPSTSSTPKAGSTLYVRSYAYADREGDPEGATSIRWYRDGALQSQAGRSYVVLPSDRGHTITAVVTPRAKSGTIDGDPATSNGLRIASTGSFNPFTNLEQAIVQCSPQPLSYPVTPPMSTTCTATVTARYLYAKYPNGVNVTGTASFRTLSTGGFGDPAGSTNQCALGNKTNSHLPVDDYGTITVKCSIRYTPGDAALHGIVAAMAINIPGGYGAVTLERSTNVAVQPAVSGNTVRLDVTGLANGPAGSPQSVTVTARDPGGAVATGYTGTVHFTSTDAKAVLPSDYTFTGADAGVHTFTDGVTPKKIATTTVTATDTSTSSIAGSQTVTIGQGAAATLQVTGLNTGANNGRIQAGSQQSVTVTALDAAGNVAKNYVGTIHFSSDDPIAVLPANATFAGTDQGVHTFSGIVLKTSNTHSVTATDVGTPSITGSKSVIVNPAPATHLDVAASPPTQTAGVARLVVVTARDQFGNLDRYYRGTVHLTSDDAIATLPTDKTFTASDNGEITIGNVILKTAGVRTITATDTVTASVKGTGNAMVVPGVATKLLVSGLAVVPTGTPQSVTVKAVDAYGNVAPSYAGTVAFTSTDVSAVLPSNYAFTGGDNGIHTFPGVTLVTVGSKKVTATDTVTSTITGSQTVTVLAGPAVALAVATTGGQAGVARDVTVTAQDPNGNVATGYTGTIHFTSTDPLAVLPANYTFTAADLGKHTFTGGLTLKTTGAQSVTATDTVASSITGAKQVTITNGPVTSIQLTGLTDGPPGTPQSVTVKARDAYGNIATSYRGTVHFTSSDGAASLPADYVFVAGDAGQHQFSVTLNTTGAWSVTVTDQAARTDTKNVTVNGSNDDFASAQTISGASGTVNGSNTGATTEPNEPQTLTCASGLCGPEGPDATVWYRWTAPADAVATFDSCNPSGDFWPNIAVYTGSTLATLTRVTESDGVGCFHGARVRFRVDPGQTYYLQVDGDGVGEEGSFTLNWVTATRPANDDFADAEILSGNTGTTTGNNDDATREPGEPATCDYGGASCQASRSLWYAWTAPTSGSVTFDTCHGGTNFDAVIAAYDGSSLGSLSQLTFGDQSPCDSWSSPTMTFAVVSGHTYHVQVAGYGDASHGPFSLNWHVDHNDDLVDAFALSGTSGTMQGVNDGATVEAGEPATCDGGGGCGGTSDGPNATVWYRWTPSIDGNATVDVCSATFDSMLAVYTGSSYPLSRVAGNDDAAGCGSGTQSRISFSATAGTTYRIQVDGKGGASGPFDIAWQVKPPNDDFAGATAISTSSGLVAGTYTGATSEAGEPAACCDGDPHGPDHTLWYAWAAPVTGQATVYLCGADEVAAYEGSSLGTLTRVTEASSSSNDCGGRSTTSITFAASSGTTYMVQVDGSGDFQLSWSLNDEFANATALSGNSGSIGGTNVGATSEVGEPQAFSHTGAAYGPNKTVWFSWTAPSAGTVQFDVCNADTGFDTMLGAFTGSSVGSLTRIAENDEGGSGCGHQSKVTFNVTSGTTYRISLDGYNGEHGHFTLSWLFTQGFENDPFSGATVIAGSSGSIAGSNVGATTETGEPAAASGPNATVWYRWTAPADGSVTFDTCGASFDTMLGAYTGSAVNALSRLAGSDDDPTCTPASKVTFSAVSGTTYAIQVDGWSASRGTFTLHWSMS